MAANEGEGPGLCGPYAYDFPGPYRGYRVGFRKPFRRVASIFSNGLFSNRGGFAPTLSTFNRWSIVPRLPNFKREASGFPLSPREPARAFPISKPMVGPTRDQ